MSRNTHSRLHLDQARKNAATVWDVPCEVMPNGAAQLCLVALALTGYEVRCYQSGGPSGTWVVWLDELQRRVTLEEWQHDYAAIVAELYGQEEAPGA
ncbi:MAG TPA: hypothetical protein VGS80_17840 [Ktedonobacterales bacterium]|nr:hypothetical protein [Ktedonobacterales bacterium]